MGYSKKKDKKAARKRQNHKSQKKNLTKTLRNPSKRAAVMNSTIEVAKQNRSNPKANIVLSAKKLRLKRKRLSRIERAKSQMDIEGPNTNTSKTGHRNESYQMDIDDQLT